MSAETDVAVAVDTLILAAGPKLGYERHGREVDTIGQAIDALNAGIAMINAASERMKALGLTPQISVNGHDYGDKVSVYIQGELMADGK